MLGSCRIWFFAQVKEVGVIAPPAELNPPSVDVSDSFVHKLFYPGSLFEPISVTNFCATERKTCAVNAGQRQWIDPSPME